MVSGLSDGAHRVLERARMEARRLGHPQLDTGHILLGLATEAAGLAAQVLTRLAGSLETVYRAAEAAEFLGSCRGAPDPMPFTRLAQEALHWALEEARWFGRRSIESEDVLVGVLRANKSIAAYALHRLGITVVAVRSEVLASLDDDGWAAVRARPEPTEPTGPTGPTGDSPHPQVRPPSPERMLGLAQAEARRLGHDAVGPGHLLLGLTGEGPDADRSWLAELGLDAARIHDEIRRRAQAGNAPNPPSLLPVTVAAERALELSCDVARRLFHPRILGEHALLGLLRDRDGLAAQVLRQLGADVQDVRRRLLARLQTFREPADAAPAAPRRDLPARGVKLAELQRIASNWLLLETWATAGHASRGAREQRKTPALDTFTTDAAATEAGRLAPPLVGRDAVLERVLAVLHRHRHRNVALVGPPGVGKTAVVSELARRMAAGDRVGRYAGHRLLTLDVALLVAGTKYRGQLEERARALVTEVRRAGNVVLHVEDPALLASNGYQGESMTVAEALAPLARGDVGAMIVTATPDALGRTLEGLRLAHLYARVEVAEPEPAAALAMVAAHRDVIAAHHDVELTDDALELAVAGALTLVNRHLPSSALDLLDETCARAARLPRTTRKPVVDAAAVRATLAAYRAPDR